MAVLATLARLEVDPTDDAMAQLALTLADALDGNPGAQVANLSRELRNTLLKVTAGNDDDDPAWNALMQQLTGPSTADG